MHRNIIIIIITWFI